MREIQTRRGAIMLWRLGTLKFGEQSRWEGRAPESKGMWAFPWPYYDQFFTGHQYDYYIPKELSLDPDTRLPVVAKWYTNSEGKVYTEPPERDENGYALDPTIRLDNRFWELRQEWINTVGKKVLPLRKFWFEGYLYSRMRANGEIMASGWDEPPRWARIHSSELADAIRKTRGTVTWMNGPWTNNKLEQVTTSVDHLEVFIPRGGKITGNLK